MKNLLYWIVILLTISIWPISFWLSNTRDGFLLLIPSTLIVLDLFFIINRFQYHYFIYLLLPLIHPAFLLFPLFYLLFNLQSYSRFPQVVYLIIFLLISIINFRNFYAYSIFTPDPLASDTLIKKISLIPNRNLARVFENKTTIFQDKFKDNIFVSLDPNSYFFAYHPRELGNGQNLFKFPFLSLIFFTIGLYSLSKFQYQKWLISIIISCVFSIALINNQDRFDIFLCVPVSIICLIGINKLFERPSKLSLLIALFFVSTSIFEVLRFIQIYI